MAIPKKKFYLGVEGGATKSTAILVDEHGILTPRVGKNLNYHNIGEVASGKNLQALLSPLLKKTEKQNLFAVFGFAGLDTHKDKLVYQKIAKLILPKSSKFEVLNDANIALEAKCPGEQDRILVISGTGSTVVGQSGSKEAKSVGWGFILGDEGSGYETGLKVLKSAMQSWDGRIQKSAFELLVLEKARVQSMEDFIPRFYKILRDQKQDVKSFIASFAQLVDNALAEDDWRAKEIRDETVMALLQGVRAVTQKLRIQDKRFSIGLVGSVWKMRGLSEKFQSEIQRQFPQAIFSKKQELGAWGAVLLAKKLT